MSQECPWSGSTTGTRCGFITRNRWPTPAARVCIACSAARMRSPGLHTIVEVNSIIATIGHTHNPGNLRHDYIPPLNNQTLFKRDAHLCLYCGMRFPSNQLSRDHIRPLSQGGRDTWTNVVTACRRCNNLKASKTPEQAGLQLHRCAVHADLCRVHLSERPPRAGRPDGISARALSRAPVRCTRRLKLRGVQRAASELAGAEPELASCVRLVRY